jgi:dipeptidyl aminopeptidase/acylaminoacyl peptidase
MDLEATGNPEALTRFHPQLAQRRFPTLRVLSYQSAEGYKGYALLYLPKQASSTNKVPMVLVADYGNSFSDVPRVDLLSYWGPAMYARNQRILDLLSDGYAVLLPDLPLSDLGVYAGLSKQVAAAVNIAVDSALATGVIDDKRLGLVTDSATNYGGFIANTVITQTERFKAAVTIGGAVDWFDAYYRTPPGFSLIYEQGDPRFQVPPWEDPQRYLDHSPLAHWNKVKTPLLAIYHGQNPDGAKLLNASMELQTPAVFALARRNDGVDTDRRIRGWFREHFLGEEPISHVADQGSFIFGGEAQNSAPAGAK